MTLEEQDVEAFTEAVKEYDSVSRLDPWYENLSFDERWIYMWPPPRFTTLLIRVKKQIPVEDDLC